MKSRCWFILLVLVLGACGSRSPATGVTAGEGDEEWVCRPEGEAWDCAQGSGHEAPDATDQG